LSAPRTALISCLRLLGDVVLSLPLLDMVKSEHPACEIDYLVPAGSGAFLRCDPRIRNVIEHQRGGLSYIPKILFRYDWSFGIDSSDRSVISVITSGVRKRVARLDAGQPIYRCWKNLALTNPTMVPHGAPVIKRNVHLARAAGLNPSRCHATVHWSGAHEETVERLLIGAGIANDGHFVVHPFSRFPHKEWDLTRVAAASDHIARTHGLRPVWTGSGSDRDRALLAAAAERATVRPVLCAGTLDLNAVTCLIARARLYIGVDTGISHFAATTGTPMVALFGPTPTCEWAPWNNERELDYEFPKHPGSFRNGHISVLQDAEAHLRDNLTPPKMHLPTTSMAAISVDAVVDEANHQLTSASVHSLA
jgi:heptosyltransferase-3